MDPGHQPPLRPPTLGEPAWLPDPTRRHQLRWFDGAAFTDHVADGAVRSTDAGGPSVAPGPVAAPTTGATKGGRTTLVLAGIGIGAVLGGGAYLLFGSDDGRGFGTFEGTVGADAGEHRISLRGGSAAVVLLDPSSDLDAIVGFRVDGGDADRIGDLYADTPFADEASPDGGEVFRMDVGYEGEEEVTFLAVPFDVDATVVVSGYGDSEGDYELEIRAIGLDGVDGDTGGEALLDALLDADDLPRDLREHIVQRLDE